MTRKAAGTRSAITHEFVITRTLAEHAGLLARAFEAAQAGDAEHGSDAEIAARCRTTILAATDFLASIDKPAYRRAASAGRRPPARRTAPAIAGGDDQYRPRPVGNETDVEYLRRCRRLGRNVVLAGPPGVGKTALVRAAFTDELETFGGHRDAEAADLIGHYTPRAGGGFDWIDGPAVQAMRFGRVLFLDDASLCPSGVLHRLLSAMDWRRSLVLHEHRSEIIDAVDGFIAVAAYNPRVGTSASCFEASGDPLERRFADKVEILTDYGLARTLGVDERVVRLAAAVELRRREGDAAWSPQMRELLDLRRLSEEVGLDLAIDNLVGLAPESDRTLVLDIVRQEFPLAAPLRVGDRA